MKKIFLFCLLSVFPLACFSQEKGYMNVTTFGVLAGTSSDVNEAPLSILSEHQYLFNRFISAGLVTGIEQLNENTLPLATVLRLYIPVGRIRFFMSAQGGYSVALEKPHWEEIDKARGGALAGAETGIQIPINNCASLLIGLGYRHSKLRYEMSNRWMGSYKIDYTYNRFSVRIGLVIF